MRDKQAVINIRLMEKPLLPVFFVLDCSNSMSEDSGDINDKGTPISMLNRTMENLMTFLKKFALDNTNVLLKIGILQVRSGVDWILPRGLEEINHFVYSPLDAGGMTDMGHALTELDDKLTEDKFLKSYTGWFKPIIIFMTDGYPTDDWKVPLRKLMLGNSWYQRAIKIGFAVGKEANAAIISEIVGSREAVIQTDNLDDFSDKFSKKVAVSIAEGAKYFLPVHK